MPQVFNLPNSIDGLNANVRSVRCWFYNGPLMSGYPQPPTPMPTLVAESADPATSHYVVFEGFTQNNANGTSLGRGSLDVGTAKTLQEYYNAVGMVAILQAAFGEP